MRVVKVAPLLMLCALTVGLSHPGWSKSAAAPTEFGVNKDGEFDPQLAANQYAKMSNKAFVDAQAKEKAGDLKNAEQLYRQSLGYRERVWGQADPGVIKLYDIIGGLAQRRNAIAESERCYRIVLMATIKKYGQGTYEEVDPLAKLAKVYLAEKKYSDAAKEYDQICQLESRKHGPHDQRTVQAALDLAKVYLITPETTADAVDALKPYAEASDKSGDMPLLLPVLDTYASALRKHHKTDLADKVQARADELRKSSGAAPAAADNKADAAKDKADATAGATTSADKDKDKAAEPSKDSAKNQADAGADEKKNSVMK